jgi:UDP-N-acetylmuramoyl-tripeptide--D-alanyl-D-alanine ligase
VAAAVSGVVLSGERAHAFTGVSIDTRTLKAGELYIAIRGERFDGADFAEAAIVAGAAGAVVPRGRGQALVAARAAVASG